MGCSVISIAEIFFLQLNQRNQKRDLDLMIILRRVEVLERKLGPEQQLFH
jgi:hypothetical protein